MIPDREIRTPGEGLLPPSTELIPPPDLRRREQVRVIPPCPPWQPTTAEELRAFSENPHLPPFDRRYWRISDAYTDYPRGMSSVWTNDPGLVPPVPGSGRGVGGLPEVSIFEVDRGEAKETYPDFWEGQGLLAMSTRVLEVLLEVDPDAIVHKPMRLVDRSGKIFDDDHHFVDVIRIVPAVDYANSIIDYYGGEPQPDPTERSYSLSFISTRFVDGIDPKFKIFRQAAVYGGGRGCFVADDLMIRLLALKPRIRNAAFNPLYNIF